MKLKRSIVAAGLGVAVAGGAAVPAIASAASAAPDPAPAAAQAPHAKHGHHKKHRGQAAQRFAEQLAQKLGVPKEKVLAALKEIRQAHRAQPHPKRQPGQPADPAAFTKRMDAFAGELAGKLGLPKEKVLDALKQQVLEHPIRAGHQVR